MVKKMKKKIYIRGQNLTELAIVFGIVGLVLLGMQTYVTRGVQGKFKDLTDRMISPTQEPYPQDISMLTVNTSGTTVKISSETKSAEFLGGQRRVFSVTPEVTTQHSISASAQ